MAILTQVICSVIVCLPCLNLGVMWVLPSSTVANFSSNFTLLHRPMTELEVGLFGSLTSAGAMVGTPITAALLDRTGRKVSTVLAGLTCVISWAILAISSSVEVVLIAIFIGGLSGASFLIVPVYCGEFCQESIRGTMTAGSMVFCGVGMLISYILGDFCSYMNMVYISLALSVASVVVTVLLKESPTLLMKKGLTEKAAESISFYRQVNLNSKLVADEMRSIEKSLDPLESGQQPEEEMLFPNEVKTKINDIKLKPSEPKKLSLWQFYKRSQPTRRGFYIALMTMALTIFQGIIVVQVYLEPLFRRAVPNLSSTVCCLLFAVTIVVASFAAAFMSDLAGRRPLIIYSSIGGTICCVLLGSQLQLDWGPGWLTALVLYVFCAVYSFGGGTVPFVLIAEVFLPEPFIIYSSIGGTICCVLLGSQLQLDWGPGWLTALVLYVFCAVYSFGDGTVPFVLIAEVFLPEVKSFMTMLVVEWFWLCSFLSLIIFNPLMIFLGLGGVFYVFAAVCVVTAVMSAIYVPETKGLTLEAVQLMLAERRNF